MPTVTATDMLALETALGPNGRESARRIVPHWDDATLCTPGTCPLATSSATVKETGFGRLQVTTINFTSFSQSMTDEAGVVAYGGTKVYDFPEGNILILGATLNATLTKSGAGINADFDGDVGVGTVTASNNATLSSTEQNIIPTTATPQAVAGATTAKGINAAAIAPLDGTATAVDMYLNYLIDDADQDITGGGASSLLTTGTLTFCWINLGDK